ncbi:hypothetical protein G9X67_34720 [Rhizobium sp. WYCCWR 11152]|uniref:hypothetical protein n=1 Tax=Rhizobium sp. WYCCWR 11152 TaxID=2692316 RepID=UPI001493251C|nr:hypothetical protein [Rhizobium sp. WYCCWR 11152]NNU70407.1 hypothetical protein [Rhizobium sp. WYCCWR 11152]
MADRNHLIEVLHADGRSEWFCGWDMRNEPDFSTDRDMAVKYDLTFNRDEVLTDYERLCEMGFDASIETAGFVRLDYSENARLEHVFASVIVRGATLVAAE